MKQGWKTVKLGDVCEIARGGSPRPIKNYITEEKSGINWIKIGDANNDSIYITKTKEKIKPEGRNKSRQVYAGDLILSNSMSFGRPYILKIEGCIHDGWLLIRDLKNNFDKTFLCYMLGSPNIYAQFKKFAVGGVVNNLNSSLVKRVIIPLPPLNDQIRIAHLLSKVGALIARRKHHLQQLDELLKSVFLEMFGFIDGTYNKWVSEKLSIQTDIISGVTKGKKYKDKELIEVPYMRVANVQDGYFDLDEIKTIAVSKQDINRYQLEKGDLLLTEGGDPDKLGRGSVWENQVKKCIHQNHIFRVRIKNRKIINPYYLSALVASQYGKRYFLKSAKQTTGIASINSTQLKNFPAIIPPIEFQNKFATIVGKVEGIKTQYQQSLTDLENLYGTLSQKAFKGELDLSRVPMPVEPDEADKEPVKTEPESVLPKHKKRFEFSAPDQKQRMALSSAEGRKPILRKWLEEYLQWSGRDAAFSVDSFMKEAQQKLDELDREAMLSEQGEEGAEPVLGINDYDHLKAWVFDQIRSGRIEQNRNSIDMGDKQELGNTIILKNA